MCGRYVSYTDQDYAEMADIVNEIQKKLDGRAEVKTGEIFPDDLAPVLSARDGAIEPEAMSWGFYRWSGGGVVINARAESAAQKQMFRSSLFTRRLVVPSTGFFEWRWTEGRKQKEKYLLRLPGTEMLYMAGLYRFYAEPDGISRPRFVILTTGASESVAPLHDRMPVILGKDELEQWLVGSDISALLSRPGPALEMEQVG